MRDFSGLETHIKLKKQQLIDIRKKINDKINSFSLSAHSVLHSCKRIYPGKKRKGSRSQRAVNKVYEKCQKQLQFYLFQNNSVTNFHSLVHTKIFLKNEAENIRKKFFPSKCNFYDAKFHDFE